MAQQRKIFPGALSRGTLTAAVLPSVQLSVVNVTWGRLPACVAVYLDAPAWQRYHLDVTVQPLAAATSGQPDAACLAKAVRWRSVVVGAEQLPRPLATTVGFETPFPGASYTIQVREQQRARRSLTRGTVVVRGDCH